MNNITKQRFVKQVIELLEGLSCKEDVEHNKHYKVKDNHHGRISTWRFSTIPSHGVDS